MLGSPATMTASLRDQYKTLAQQLRVTGGGLRDPNDPEGDTQDDGTEHLEFYIPPEGPTAETCQKAKNIWRESYICFRVIASDVLIT